MRMMIVQMLTKRSRDSITSNVLVGIPTPYLESPSSCTTTHPVCRQSSTHVRRRHPRSRLGVSSTSALRAARGNGVCFASPPLKPYLSLILSFLQRNGIDPIIARVSRTSEEFEIQEQDQEAVTE
ncbi:unnamed protein product [Cercospora beticola]|nr:unnamed protein product [Cercospora beticola]